MNQDVIKQKLLLLCEEIFQNTCIEYADFIEDIGMDSITFITLIVEIETVFDITIPDDILLMENFRDLNKIIDIINYEAVKRKIYDKA